MTSLSDQKAFLLNAFKGHKLCAKVEAILLSLAELEASQWVSVKDRLPEPEKPVALINVHKWENCANDLERNIQACGYLSAAAPYWSIRGERATDIDAFTHWKPLNPPIDADKQEEKP